jgi:hypothetical protein
MPVVLAVEITLALALVVMLALNWRMQRRLDARVDVLYRKHKILMRDAHRALLEAASLHESNVTVLSDPRIQRLLNERELPSIQ